MIVKKKKKKIAIQKTLRIRTKEKANQTPPTPNRKNVKPTCATKEKKKFFKEKLRIFNICRTLILR